MPCFKDMQIEEKKLIEKLEEMSNIKPDADWVLLAEQKITACEPAKKTFAWIDLGFVAKPAFSLAFSAIAVVSLTGGVGLSLAQNALPGDLLYPVKKASQNVRMAFVSNKDMPMAQLELAQTKLEELAKVTRQDKNQGQKLAASIAETQRTIEKASKSLKQMSDTDKQEFARQVVGQLESLKTQQKIIEQTIRTDIINDVQKSALAESAAAYYKLYLDSEIERLENSSLTEAQELLLSDAKKALEESEVEEALDIVVNQIPAKKDMPQGTNNSTSTEKEIITEDATSTEKTEDSANQTTTEDSK
jgi:hypothetical protein